MTTESNNQLELNLESGNTTIESLGKRARAKYFNSLIVGKLIDFNKNVLGSEYWTERYRKTFYCSHSLKNENGDFQSKFCKYKICIICSRIKTAQLIHKYYDAIHELEDLQLLTLTIPNCRDFELMKTIRTMNANFTKIREKLRKRKLSGEPIILRGTRNLEITFNPEYFNPKKGKEHLKGDCYHPHYHCIIEGKEAAENVKKEWLKLYPEALADFQNIKPLGDSETDLLECFKYTMKFLPEKKETEYNIVISDIDYETPFYQVKELVGTNNLILDSKIYIEAVDVINKAVSGIGNNDRIRTFQAFGIKGKPDVELPTESEILETEPSCFEPDYWDYYFNKQENTFDWLNRSTGELLTNFVPSSNLEQYQNDNKYVEKNTFDYNFNKFIKEQKPQNIDIKEYNKQIAHYRKLLQRSIFDFSVENIENLYKDICEAEKLDIHQIKIVDKIERKALGMYVIHRTKSEIERFIIINKDVKIWRYVLIHEIAHQLVAEKLYQPFHRHTSIFRREELRLLNKYLFIRNIYNN